MSIKDFKELVQQENFVYLGKQAHKFVSQHVGTFVEFKQAVTAFILSGRFSEAWSVIQLLPTDRVKSDPDFVQIIAKLHFFQGDTAGFVAHYKSLNKAEQLKLESLYYISMCEIGALDFTKNSSFRTYLGAMPEGSERLQDLKFQDLPNYYLKAISHNDKNLRSEMLFALANRKPTSLWSQRAQQSLLLNEILSESKNAELLAQISQLKSWERFEKIKLFGDFGFPYQGWESFKIAGMRPTEQRLSTYGVEKYISKNSSILDIGCNNGFLLLALSDRVASAVGIDVSNAAISMGKLLSDTIKADNVKLFNTDFDTFLTLNEEKFDCIFACAVHHWLGKRPSELVKECQGMLKPDGVILIESQGKRNPGKIEPLYQEDIETLLQTYEHLDTGEICDDGINHRRFDIFRLK